MRFENSTRAVPLVESMIQAIFVQIIHAVNHLIVSPCQNHNFIVFANRDTKRMKMVSAKKLLKLMNVKLKMTVHPMQIVLILFTVRDHHLVETSKSASRDLLFSKQ